MYFDVSPGCQWAVAGLPVGCRRAACGAVAGKTVSWIGKKSVSPGLMWGQNVSPGWYVAGLASRRVDYTPFLSVHIFVRK